MVGREIATAGERGRMVSQVSTKLTPFVHAKGLARRGQLKPLDLEMRIGEVIGLGGLLGSGRTEMARLLFGLDRRDAGVVELDGEVVRLDSPAQAIRLGIALCPEDRKAEGIIGELSVRENIALAFQARLGLWPFLPRARQVQMAQHYVAMLGIKTANIETPIAQLSGGNQQKAVLARWLAIEPRLLILDEPTRGIDVAAKNEIMNEILSLASTGMSVLFISSEMDEVVRISDRIVVMRDRAKIGELPGGCTDHAVYAMIAGQA
jgi:simple sugar transport system ATP-binding protein